MGLTCFQLALGMQAAVLGLQAHRMHVHMIWQLVVLKQMHAS